MRRSSPLLAALLVLELLGATLYPFSLGTEEQLDRRFAASWFLIVLAVWVVLAVLLPIVTGRWMSRRIDASDRPSTLAAVVAVAFVVVGPGLSLTVGSLIGLGGSGVVDVGGHIAVVLLVVALTYLGLGSVLKWAGTFAWNQLGALGKLAGRALPLLMLTVVVFFTGELWQWAADVDRALVWRTTGLLALCAVAFMTTSLRDEVRTLRTRLRDRDEFRGLLSRTPFGSLSADGAAPARFSVSERINVLGVLLFSQAIQVALFTGVVFVFFVLLGAAMLPPGVIETWAGQPVTAGKLFGITLPVSNELIQMSQFVAVLSGLYFTVNSSIDPQYRLHFFDPLVVEVGESLAVREIYHHHWRNPAALPRSPDQLSEST